MRFTDSLYFIKNNSVFDMNYLKISNCSNCNFGEEKNKNKNKNKNGESSFKSLLFKPIVMLVAGILYIVILNVCMGESNNFSYQLQYSNRYSRKLSERFIYYNPNVEGGYPDMCNTCSGQSYSDESDYDVMKYTNKVMKDLKKHQLWNDHNKVPYTSVYMGVSVQDKDYVFDKEIDNMDFGSDDIIDFMKYMWHQVMETEKERYLVLKNVLRKFQDEFPLNNNIMNNYNNKKYVKCYERIDLGADIVESGLNKVFTKCLKKNELDKNKFKILITAIRFLWRKTFLDVQEECNVILELPTKVSQLPKRNLRRRRTPNPNDEVSLRSYPRSYPKSYPKSYPRSYPKSYPKSYPRNSNPRTYGQRNYYPPYRPPQIIDYVYKVTYGENADEDVDRHIEHLVERMAEEEAERIAELSVQPYIEALEASYKPIAERNSQNSVEKKVEKSDEMINEKHMDEQKNANMNNQPLKGILKGGNTNAKGAQANAKLGSATTKGGLANAKVGNATTKVGGANKKVGNVTTKVGIATTKVGNPNARANSGKINKKTK
ncbi:lysine-rich membrane-associated PHISTb protein [Plasmodium sp. gorilla clade G2]|uniref:lysine-rich membrane-associated PHISTb protein n=1 Tax=Plasmodium sp. gorilla clade G2 TaxID=880535 RepID=UPI000D2064C9|nr:lysine-rich membrane-associated PHISTb protein [Plasmodium sp. gorilla clade G2]SOV11992.1 lysine-rich membrane-associated PHISTb protein [Plasmodium sp. gorilla clade G2]